jgi:hypothetical protein
MCDADKIVEEQEKRRSRLAFSWRDFLQVPPELAGGS